VSKRGRIVSLVALAIAALVFDAFFAVRHGFFDLNVYYGAINYWHDGGFIYDFVRRNSTYGFTYPPFAALTMLPMAFVAWPVAVVIGSIATVAVTVWLLKVLLTPMIKRFHWPVWYAVGVTLCLAAVFEPMRETFLFGQVNMLLVGLVAVDLLVLLKVRPRWAGVGIGLATAIKLTPGIFIVYLLLTERWRPAVVAMVTAAGATLLTAAVLVDESREFWTSALWETERVGNLAYVSNQSLQGILARLDPVHPSKALWIVAVFTVLVVWALRCRRAIADGDEVLGFALTGLAGLLISPVTWIHHLVWAIPAMILMAERGDKRLRIFTGVAFAIMSSRLVWPFELHSGGPLAFVLANAYVWLLLAMLFVTPYRQPDVRSLEVAPAWLKNVTRSVRV
jgi:alpha-1,2-mannosyltransferase